MSISKQIFNEEKMIKLSKLQEDYLRIEYNKLNSELIKILEEIQSREKYSLAILAGTATWLVTNINTLNHYILVAISLIPNITTLINCLSVYGLILNIRWIGDYSIKIQNYFLPDNPNGFGWETYYDKRFKANRYYYTTSLGVWPLQIASSLLLFILALYSQEVKYILEHIKKPI